MEVIIRETSPACPVGGKSAGSLGIAVGAGAFFALNKPGAGFVDEAVVSRGGGVVDFADFVAVGGLFDGGVDLGSGCVFERHCAGAGNGAEESGFSPLSKYRKEENGQTGRANELKEHTAVEIETGGGGRVG